MMRKDYGQGNPQGDTSTLALFPLSGIVLFPGLELPLVIFEPRYLKLIEDCRETKPEFGVVLLESGQEVGDPEAAPHRIGTAANIQTIQTSPDGRLHVSVIGTTRFLIHSLSRELPYLTAEVEYLVEPESSPKIAFIADRLRLATVRYIQDVIKLRGGWVQDIPLPDDPAQLSFFVAQLFQGDRINQQALLEIEMTEDRIEKEESLLVKAQGRVNRLIAQKDIEIGFNRN